MVVIKKHFLGIFIHIFILGSTNLDPDITVLISLMFMIMLFQCVL